jgi:hypothetical protein
MLRFADTANPWFKISKFMLLLNPLTDHICTKIIVGLNNTIFPLNSESLILYSFKCTVELYVYEDSSMVYKSTLAALGSPTTTSSELLYYPTSNEENAPQVQTNLTIDPVHPIQYYLDICKPIYPQKLFPMYF